MGDCHSSFRTTDDENFSTEAKFEVKEFTWTIKNFRVVLGLDKELKKLNVVFNAGDTIGLPTQWLIYFKKNTDDKFGIYMQLIESPVDRQIIFANCRFKILTSGNGYKFPDLKTAVEPKDYKKSSWGITYQSESITLVDGHLLIRIQLKLYSEEFQLKSHSKSKSKVVSQLIKLRDDSQLALTNNLGKLLDSGEDADVTFQLKNGQTLKAHTLILKAQSPVFSAMFRTSMIESTSGVVIIDDLSYEAMRTILRFIYTGKPSDNWKKLIVEVVYGAEKYQLPLLKEFCDKTLATTCTYENVWHLLQLAKMHGLTIAEKAITDYIQANIQGIMEAKNKGSGSFA